MEYYGVKTYLHSKRDICEINFIKPIRWNTNMTELDSGAQSVPFLKQGVCLTGYNDENFLQAIKNMSEIHTLFSRHIPEKKLQGWTTGEYQGHPSMECSNRLFTPQKVFRSGIPHEFGSDIDPDGWLTSFCKDDVMIYNEENIVEYREMARKSDNEIKSVLKFQFLIY